MIYHKYAPENDQQPLDAIAYLSPVLIKPKNSFCGTNGIVASPRNRYLKLSANGGPCLTANTPAFGLGYFKTAAISPAAKTSFEFVDSNVSFTAINP